MDVTPAGVLAVWAAGLAGGLAFVASRRIVGRGYTWLSAGVTAGFGLTAALSGGGWLGYAAGACALAVVIVASRVGAVVVLAGVAGAGFFIVAVASGMPPIVVATGGVALGTITTEMMLGHWYLVDPRLPRPVLRVLALAGAAGVLVDAVALAVLGAVPWEGDTAIMGAAFVVLAATTTLLMLLVHSALGERGYSGVMAATGLSYLAMLTGAGSVVLGRLLV